MWKVNPNPSMQYWHLRSFDQGDQRLGRTQNQTEHFVLFNQMTNLTAFPAENMSQHAYAKDPTIIDKHTLSKNQENSFHNKSMHLKSCIQKKTLHQKYLQLCCFFGVKQQQPCFKGQRKNQKMHYPHSPYFLSQKVLQTCQI